MEPYTVGVYIEDIKDEKIISDFIEDEFIFEIKNKEDLFICSERAVLVTKSACEKLSIRFNDDIPCNEPVLTDYTIPNTIFVVVDADWTDNLYHGCISGDCYRKVKKDFGYALKIIGIDGIEKSDYKYWCKMGWISSDCEIGLRESINTEKQIWDGLLYGKKSLVEDYHNLCIIRCYEGLSAETLKNIQTVLEEINEIFFEEYHCILGHEIFETEDGHIFDNIKGLLRYAAKKEWKSDKYIVEKINIDSEETIVKFWYNKKMQMVAYEK